MLRTVAKKLGSPPPPWLKQLGREFVWPLVAALAWVIYNLWVVQKEGSLENLIVLFAPAFFLASWAGAQYFRVRKQVRLETDLVGIQNRIATVLESLDRTATELSNQMTGGNSYCHLRIAGASRQPGHQCVVIHQVGSYPLFDLRGTIRQLGVAKRKVLGIDLEVGTLATSHARLQEYPLVDDGGRFNLQINFYARNGDWVQLLMARKEGAEWLHATRVSRDDKVIWEKIDDGYIQSDKPVEWPSAIPHNLAQVVSEMRGLHSPETEGDPSKS